MKAEKWDEMITANARTFSNPGHCVCIYFPYAQLSVLPSTIIVTANPSLPRGCPPSQRTRPCESVPTMQRFRFPSRTPSSSAHHQPKHTRSKEAGQPTLMSIPHPRSLYLCSASVIEELLTETFSCALPLWFTSYPIFDWSVGRLLRSDSEAKPGFARRTRPTLASIPCPIRT